MGYYGVIKGFDVKIEEEAFCEHCYELEPFTPVIEDGADYCLDCFTSGNDISNDIREQIELESAKMQLEYYTKKINGLMKYIESFEKCEHQEGFVGE